MQRVQLQTPGGDVIDVALERESATSADGYVARIGDDATEVGVERSGPGEGWLRLHGKVRRYVTAVSDGTVEVWVDGMKHRFDIVEKSRRRGRQAASASPLDRVVAPMPGTVLKIPVKPGDNFEPNQPLVILESMKMEMTLSVPHAGRVKEVHCNVGELVQLGAVLATLDASEHADAS